MLGLDLFCLDTLPPSSFLTGVSCINTLGAICWGNTAERSPSGRTALWAWFLRNNVFP